MQGTPGVTVPFAQTTPEHMPALMHVIMGSQMTTAGTVQLPPELQVPAWICLPFVQLAAGPQDPEVLNAQFPAPGSPAATHWPV
jgi:hypothetical protein